MSKLKEDKLPGGLAAGMTLNDIAKKHGISVDMLVAEFKKGIGVEMEHTSDREVAKEITLDHLFEDPKYYTKLIDMEKGMNESSMGEIDILAKESKTFKDFVKAFHKEYSLIELDREAVKWLEGIYNDRTNESVNEGKYYVTYNRGRGQGKGLEMQSDPKTFKPTGKPKVFSSYNDAKKYAEKMEKMFRNSIGGSTAYWVSDEKMNPIKESVNEEEKSPEEILMGLRQMAMGDLERIEDYAEMIADRMEEGQELSSWMYSQITLAVDQLNSVHDAMDGKDGVKESKDGLERVAAGLPQTEEEPINEWRAEEVLQQLGGKKFITMTGAKNFVKNDPKKQIIFKIGGGAKGGINYVRISLTSMDLYTVEFLKARGTELKVVAVEKGVYNDQLQQIFTKHTGFNTKL